MYKNCLVRRAADDAGVDLSEHLIGPTALAFAEQTPDGERGDVVTVAKVLRDFAKTNPALLIKGGFFDGQPIDADGVRALADVEPREVLLSKLAGLMAAPMQQMAGLLQALPRDFAYGLKALIDEGGAPGAPAASADDAAPADADADADDDDDAEPSEAEASDAEESAPEAMAEEGAGAPDTATESDAGENTEAE